MFACNQNSPQPSSPSSTSTTTSSVTTNSFSVLMKYTEDSTYLFKMEWISIRIDTVPGLYYGPNYSGVIYTGRGDYCVNSQQTAPIEIGFGRTDNNNTTTHPDSRYTPLTYVSNNPNKPLSFYIHILREGYYNQSDNCSSSTAPAPKRERVIHYTFTRGDNGMIDIARL